ncbi:MAG: hypothetical protein RJA25_790 [Bacteroidota bacterium]|jgi:hypothetical protein
MKIITIAVPDEEMLAFDVFIQESNVIVLDEKKDLSEITVYKVDMEQTGNTQEALEAMEKMEKELEEEIWKLHHFAE